MSFEHTLPNAWLLAASIFILSSCDQGVVQSFEDQAVAQDNSTIDKNSYENSGRCYRVVDGDSLYIEDQKTQIRLWGVDAPERDETGYQEAKDALTQLALNKTVYCSTQDIDKYNRIVARCYDANGDEINKALLESGVSKEYCRFTGNHYGFCSY